MFIKQISVSLENTPGMLSNISELLGKEGVNIRAISVADTSDISTVRFIVDDPVKAVNILRGHGYATKETEVLAVECPDHPGGVNAVLKPLQGCQYQCSLSLPVSGQGERPGHRDTRRGPDRRG